MAKKIDLFLMDEDYEKFKKEAEDEGMYLMDYLTYLLLVKGKMLKKGDMPEAMEYREEARALTTMATQEKVLAWIEEAGKKGVTDVEYAQHFGFTKGTSRRHLLDLELKGVLTSTRMKRRGRGSPRVWVIAKANTD